ncbi:CHAT domain-containing protein [Microbispora sp. H13382]|uniref:CHAT domain-containing protein n=1 Tax=Microbispora sp. H13382 TaxID=2729112 RepID=UPI001600517C|nr:CHAT domain-containing protein [Microbispora sp. H13382]
MNAPVLVDFHLSGREIRLFWLDPREGGTRVVTMDGLQEDLRAAADVIRRFSYNVNSNKPERTSDMAWTEPLGERLLAPLLRAVPEGSTLVIAPHQRLHDVPVHLLKVAGWPVGLRYPVSYVPSLSLYGALRRRGPRVKSGAPVAFATAYAEQAGKVADAFTAAPEAFAARAGGRVFLGAEASRESLLSSAPEADIVYLSCHGAFSSIDAADSALLLSHEGRQPSRGRPDDPAHRLTVRDVLGLDLKARLLILDACMSGRQHFRMGDEPLGFPAALLLAGAQAIVAANWSVDYRAAEVFMSALLDNWIGGGPIGAAMLAAYRETHRKFPHPFHWAGFSLHGDDRLHYEGGSPPLPSRGGSESSAAPAQSSGSQHRSPQP